MHSIYVTDGSYEGLLSAVFTGWNHRQHIQDIVPAMPDQLDFTLNYHPIHTDATHAQRVHSAIEKDISHHAARNVMMCWLSELPGCGRWILNYLDKGFAEGEHFDADMTHPSIYNLQRAAYKVGFEMHRMMGLCRFRLMEQGYYMCRITPDHNMLPLISPHFADRMADSRWIILDETRGNASVYDAKQWVIVSISELPELPYSPDEHECAQSWQAYHDAIAIRSRINPKLQRSFMPQRYWKHLVEIPDQLYRDQPK